MAPRQSKKWTTEEEEKFLTANVPQFEASQSCKMTGQWLQSLEIMFFNRFQEYNEGGSKASDKALTAKVRTATTT